MEKIETEIYKKYLELKDSKIAETLDHKELMKLASEIVMLDHLTNAITSY